MSLTPSQQPGKNELSVPSAPYPPMHFRSPQKSALSSSPHYSSSFGYRNSESGTVQPSLNSLSSSTPRAGESFTDPGEDSAGLTRQAYPEPPKNSSTAPTQAPHIQICPSKNDMVACINCIPTTNCSPNLPILKDLAIRQRKVGPLLLELRQIELAGGVGEELDPTFFTTRTCALSRGNPSLGSSVASTCLDLPTVKNYSSHAKVTLAAATGLTTGMLCIHTFDDELDEDGLLASSIEYYHTPRNHRQASAVAWRPNNYNQVAIGLLGSSASGSQAGPGPRRGGPSIRAGGDREFCCFLWDIEAQQSSAKRNSAPMSKLSHNAPVASLAWVLDGQTLAIGGQSRNIQLYDMRVSGTNVPPISAHAHSFGVHGIEVDPHKPHILATFCRSVGEPVKLWDIRRMDSVVSEIKVYGTGSSRSMPASSLPASQVVDQGIVEAVKWSTLEPGILSVAIDDSVCDYDTTSGSRPVLVRVNHTKQGQSFKDIALYDGQKPKQETFDGIEVKSKPCASRLIEALYPRRMLAVLGDRTMCDMARTHNAPVALSRRDGRLVHALGPSVWVGSTSFGPSAMENAEIAFDEDISATMMRRARCLRVARYSMNPSSNIKLLSGDMPLGTPSNDMILARFALFRLWSWIDRVESLSADAEDIEDETHWPAKGLLDASIWHLLGMDAEAPIDDVTFSKMMSLNVYDSPARRAALTSCGWAGKFDLINVLAECESHGEYERSAALAVWHGDVGAAVEALQRASGAVRLRLSTNNSPDPTLASLQYAETLDLISMCIAGFPESSTSRSSVWQGACANLLRREDLSVAHSKTNRAAYLRGLCQFLLNVGKSDSLDQVLGNDSLSLSDRVAFACRFLEQKELKSFLVKCIASCQTTGNVEGLVVTGLTRDGIKILQSFVDGYADVQTAALVVSRVVLPSEWAAERRICLEWVESYRGLLNTWQMWQSRAMFDVDRAEVLRRIKARIPDGIQPGGSKAPSYSSRRLQSRRQGPRPVDPDVLASIPAQLDARCNYCSSPLGLRRHEGNANQWLSKMKPVLSCCPQCRKPLPRCAICLLSLGCLNPYMELTRERARPGLRGNGSVPAADDLSPLANLPFAEWFTWCMRCKHGGHAHHLIGWFASHEACPVSGCECHCQFDGIQKLNRPALCQNT